MKKRLPNNPFTPEDLAFMVANYPTLGLEKTAQALGRNKDQIRVKASKLGLKIDRTSDHFKEWQQRAAASKVGKKRPAQAEVMKRLRAEGKLPPPTAEQRKAMSERAKKWIAENGHPRGSLGMKHTPESLKKMSDASTMMAFFMPEEKKQERVLKILKTRAARGTLVPPKHGNWKADWREIGGVRKYYRSRWEANYARLLEFRKARGDIKAWEHEPETFWFEKVKRGVCSYLPDFRVTLNDGSIEYHEVKGWMDAKSKTKLKRMKQYHPAVVVVLIDSRSYGKLNRLFCKTIEGWE